MTAKNLNHNITHCSGKFTGTGVALVTPFDNEGTIDYQSLERLLEKVLEAGLDNLVLFGTTGESPTISPKERKATIEFVKQRIANTNCNLIVGMALNDTVALTERIRTTDFEGINGILSATPYYNKPTQEGLYRHFSAIVKSSPVPVIVYNIPGRTGCDILPETLLRLRNDFPERIVATKESTGKPERVSRLVALMDEEFSVLSGDDCHTLTFMRAGARGAISVIANAFPKLAKEIVDKANTTDTEATKAVDFLDKELCDLYSVLFEDGNPAGIKSMLKEMNLITTDVLRLPLVPVSESTHRRIVEVLGYLRRNGY